MHTIRCTGVALALFGVLWVSACRIDGNNPEVVHPPEAALADSAFSDLIRPLLALARAHPEKPEAHGELGLVYEANELWPEARACFDNAARLDSSSGIWELHAAIVRRQAGDLPGARSILENLSERFPTSAPVWQQLGTVQLEFGEAVAAETAFRRVTEIAPQRPHGYVGAADALLQQGKPETAVKAVSLGLERDPGYRMAHYVLGMAYLQLGQEEEAEIALSRGADAVFEYLPDPLTQKVQQYTLNPSRLSLIAQRVFQDGAKERAARMLEHAFRYHPTNSILLNNLAIVYMELGRMDDAADLLVQAGRQPDPSHETFVNLAYYFSKTGQADSALYSAERALELAPESHAAHLALAQALMELGDFSKALVQAEQALKLGAYDARTFGLVGDLKFRSGQMKSACSNLEMAVSISPSLLPAWIRLAEARNRLGDLHGAEQALGRARSLDPSNSLLRHVEQQLSGRS